MRKLQLPKSYVDRIVESIAESVPTHSIYIFGSYARGEENKDSDIDIYVVTKDDFKRPAEYVADVRRRLSWITLSDEVGLPKGKDVLGSSPESFEKRSTDLSSLGHVVQLEGVRIYG